LDSGSDLLEPTKAGTWTEMHHLFVYSLIQAMHALNIHPTFGDVQRDVGRGVARNPGP
jgi:hypothetical protein